MKTVFIGDIHGRDSWKAVVRQENPDRIVFVGDYFDSRDPDITAVIQIHNFKEIVEFKETGGKEVIMLIGNHDHHYFPWIGNTGTSGFQAGAAPEIGRVLDDNKHHLQMCYGLDNILCSHAGIGYNWLVEQMGYDASAETTSRDIADFVNDVWKYKPKAFQFTGNWDPSGDEQTQTPIWIRPRSLMNGNRDTFLKEEYIQIMGHTQVATIDMAAVAGGKYYFIDALGVGQYLIYDDGSAEFSKGELIK